MAKSLQPWLGAFIQKELAAVVEWRNQVQHAPKVKQDPDSRYNDDGSNFRSTVESPPLTADCKAQILKVVSTAGSPTVLLSDGTTSIKAKLADSAVRTLEEELEEKLSVEMKGDVVSLLAVKVASTPYGPAEGHVQIEVDELQYQYHLRKTIGNPTPTEQHKEIAGLVENISKIRAQQYDGNAVEETVRPPKPRVSSPAAVLGASRADDHDNRQQIAPRTQPRLQSQSPINGTTCSQTQAAIATQMPARKKQKVSGPTLAKEGYEVEAGVNLLRPSERTLDSTKKQAPAVRPARPVAVSSEISKLLNLLGGPSNPAPMAFTAPTASTAPMPSIVPDVIELDPDPEPIRPVVDLELEHKAQPPQATSKVNESTRTRSPQPTQRPLAKRPRTPVGDDGSRIMYARCKVPMQQRSLLEKKQSWFPSLPGQQFPPSNVPIELQKTWSTNGTTDSATSPTKPVEVEPDQLPAPQESSAASDDDGSMDTSSTSDEEIPSSQWQPTPTPPKREMLPPDSTIGSGQDGSQFRSPRKTPLQSPAKPPSIAVESPMRSSLGTPQFTSTQQQLPLRSPVKHHPASSSGSADGARARRTDRSSQYTQHTPPSRPTASIRRDDYSLSQLERHSPPPRSPASYGGGDSYRPSYSSARTRERPPRREHNHSPPYSSARPPARPYFRENNYRPHYSSTRSIEPPPVRGDRRRAVSPPSRSDKDVPVYTHDTSDRRSLTSDRDRVRHANHDQPDPRQRQQAPGPRHDMSTTATPRSSGLDTVIKGTQYSNGDGEMETDVPRPLKDPALEHRHKRSEHFKGVQRREW